MYYTIYISLIDKNNFSNFVPVNGVQKPRKVEKKTFDGCIIFHSLHFAYLAPRILED